MMIGARWCAGALVSTLILGGCMSEAEPEGAAAVSAPRDAGPPVTSIDQLYSLPSIAGTSPEGAVWSGDGKALAFLWNDKGASFRDVWVWSVEDDTRVRLTDHGQQQPEDTEHEGVSEVAWLQDNRQVAYILDGRAWTVEGGGAPEPLSDAGQGVRDLQPSPTGRHLAYIAEGKLWLQDPETKEPARVLVDSGRPGIFVERFEWSAAGDRIALVMTDNRDVREIGIHYYADGEARTYRTTRAFPGDETSRRRIGIADLDGGEVQWFERPDEQHPIWGFGLSADGQRLFLDSSDFLIKERTVDVYDVPSGERTVWYRSSDPEKVMPGWAAAWSAGDDGLIILSDSDGWFHLYHQESPGTPARQLTSGDWEIASFEIDAENDRLWFLANEAHRSELHLYRVPISGGEVEQVTHRPGTHAPVFAPGFALAADRFSNDTTPPELYVRDLREDTEAQQITASPRPEFARLPLADVSYVEFESHVDGTPLLGRLSLPRDFDASRQYPLLMGSIYPNSVRNRWGAGNAIPTWGLDQHLVERGYILMKVDVRGSWGHGKEVRQDLFRDYGGIDKDDVESGVRHLVNAGFVDPERVGVWGWSYGGLMTLMSMFHKPDLYAVGIADAPATNVAHAFPEQMWVMGRPEGEDFPERYERMSALYHSAGLSRPLMITHATKDATVLYSDTIALAERMIAQGKMFELVTLPGSSHVWAEDRNDQQRFGYRKMVEFFDRHLQP